MLPFSRICILYSFLITSECTSVALYEDGYKTLNSESGTRLAPEALLGFMAVKAI